MSEDKKPRFGKQALQKRIESGELTSNEIIKETRFLRRIIRDGQKVTAGQLDQWIQDGADISGEWPQAPNDLVLLAAEKNRTEVLELFKERGVNLHQQDANGKNALFYTANPKTFDYLLKQGITPISSDGTDLSGELLYELARKNKSCLKQALEAGINPNAIVSIFDINKRFFETVPTLSPLLIQYGIDPDRKAQFGHSQESLYLLDYLLRKPLLPESGDWFVSYIDEVLELVDKGVEITRPLAAFQEFSHQLSSKTEKEYTHDCIAILSEIKKESESNWEKWKESPHILPQDSPLLTQFANIGKLENYFCAAELVGQESLLIEQLEQLRPPFLQMRAANALDTLRARMKQVPSGRVLPLEHGGKTSPNLSRTPE